MADILYCINHSYTGLLMTNLFTLKRSAGFDDLHVHIIHRDLTQEDMDRIHRLEDDSLCISFIRFDAGLLDGSPTTSRYPVEIYFRLFAPVLLPVDIDRILYLDVDIICINSLVELYNTNIENYYIAGCTHTKRMLTRINAIRLGMGSDSRACYINTGVMLMNLAKLRSGWNPDRLFSFIRDKGQAFVLPDQDIVMALYGERIRLVDHMRYNLSDRMLVLNNLDPDRRHLSLDDVRRECALIHYCGRNKPWKERYNGQLGVFYHEAASQLERYLDQLGG